MALGEYRYGGSSGQGGASVGFQSPNTQSAPQFEKVPKEDGGFDFFVNGNAASYKDFLEAGGPKLTSAEVFAALDAAAVAKGVKFGSGSSAADLYNTPPAGGGVTSEPTTPPTFERYYNGQLYTDIDSYNAAVDASILDAYNKSVTQINKMYDAGLISLDEREKSINRTKENLGKQRTSALESQQGYFNNISPDAYQSQQAKYKGKVEDSYNQAMGDIGDSFGGRSYKDLSQEELAGYNNRLTETGRLARDYINFQDQKAQNLDSANQWKTTAQDTIKNNALEWQNQVDDFNNNLSSPSSSIADFSPYTNQLQNLTIAGYGGDQQPKQFSSVTNEEEEDYWNPNY